MEIIIAIAVLLAALILQFTGETSCENPGPAPR